MKMKIFRNSIIVALSTLMLIFYVTGVGKRFDLTLSDYLYQHGSVSSGEVFLVEIDAHSLEELGPYQTWTRDYVAKAIEILNEDENCRPAVIGVDVLYIGESFEDADDHLVRACKEYGNVVLGSYINSETQLIEDSDGNVYMSDVISLYEEPFAAVKNVTNQGFVNGYIDEDGYIRHGVLKQNVYEDEVPSFSYAVYQKYLEENGLQTDNSKKMPLDDNNHWYIDYVGKPGALSNGYSLSDLLDGEIPVDRMAGCVVLIGPCAEGFMDSYLTASDRMSMMYGVEIHANMVDNLIEGNFKKEVSKDLQALLIVLFTFAICYFGAKDKLLYTIIMMVAGTIGYLGICYSLFLAGFVLDVIYIPAISIFVGVIAIVSHYLKALVQKKQVESTFMKYVAPEIVKEIVKTGTDKIKLGGANLDIACLFVDIRGFTTMSEKVEPEQVVGILNQYLGLTSSCIFKHHGTLDKFIGDATMAIYNAPLPQEDYIYEAVMTGIDMVKGAKALEEEMLKKYGRTVSFGIGVHCGEAVVGNIGTAQRMDYTAIGNTVNTAARLESIAPSGKIYISKQVYEAVADRIKATSVGKIPLKGKSEEIEVFEVSDI